MVGQHRAANANAGLAYRWFSTQGYPRIKKIIEQDLGASLIFLNSHAADFAIPTSAHIWTDTFAARTVTTTVSRAKVMKLL